MATADPRPLPPPALPARVLVVEDDDNIATALAWVLAREGLAHDRLADGAQALDRIRAGRPDLVLLDIMLPGSSGYAICQNVRRDPTLDRVRILMMTARGSAVERQRGLEMGADGFVTKPFDLSDLRREVRRLLDG